MLDRKKTVVSLLIILLFAGVVVLAVTCGSARREMRQANALLEREKMNSKILDFMRGFIEKVLQADKEVDFETRLALENQVRELNNQKILDQWNKFTKSQTETEAQMEVKKLLLLLISETQVKM